MIRSCEFALAICLVSIAAAAQVPDFPALNEVLVTGERLTRPLRETASSVAVSSGDDIDSMAGVDRIEQVLAQIPNVQPGSGGEGPAIRGQDSTGVLRDLPAFLGGTRPRVTMQVDGRAVSFNEFVFGVASAWDLERVEVFRSPQTTTQGRNSIGGAIFIESRDPEYTWNGRARLLGGNLDTRQGSIAITGPLVADQLAFRITGDLRRSRSASDIADFIDGADPNDEDHGLIRVKLLVEPGALPGARLVTSYVHVDSSMPQIEGVRAPFKARQDPSPVYGVFRTAVDSMTGVFEYELSPALDSTLTLSHGQASITRFARPGLGQAHTRSSDVSVESLLNWQPASATTWLAGFHLLRTRLNQFINLSAVIGAGEFTDEQRSLGLFSEVTIRASSRLSVTAGLRFERDLQDRQGRLGTGTLDFPIDFDRTFDAWLPKLSVNYSIARDMQIGVLIQRAFNPGGTTLNFDTGDQDDFDAETLWNYGVFARTTFAGGRATLGADLFYNDFSNALRARTRPYSIPGGATAFWAEIDNVPAAESQGLEVETGWTFNEQLSLRAGVGLLDTRVIATTNPADPVLGKEFQRSPALTASAAIDWRPTDRWRLTAQGRHNSAYFSDDANTPSLRIGGSTVLDLRVAYSRMRWSVSGYARNLFNRFYLTTLTTPFQGTAGDPREFGLAVEALF